MKILKWPIHQLWRTVIGLVFMITVRPVPGTEWVPTNYLLNKGKKKEERKEMKTFSHFIDKAANRNVNFN